MEIFIYWISGLYWNGRTSSMKLYMYLFLSTFIFIWSVIRVYIDFYEAYSILWKCMKNCFFQVILKMKYLNLILFFTFLHLFSCVRSFKLHNGYLTEMIINWNSIASKIFALFLNNETNVNDACKEALHTDSEQQMENFIKCEY